MTDSMVAGVILMGSPVAVETTPIVLKKAVLLEQFKGKMPDDMAEDLATSYSQLGSGCDAAARSIVRLIVNDPPSPDDWKWVGAACAAPAQEEAACTAVV